MPKSGETVTVRKMKEAIQKAKSKGQQPVDNQAYIHNPQVVNVDNLHSQPNHNLQVVDNTENTYTRMNTSRQVVKEVNLNKLDIQLVTVRLEVLNNREVDELVAGGLTIAQIDDALEVLLPLYAAEGIKPSSTVLMAGIKQMQADVK